MKTKSTPGPWIIRENGEIGRQHELVAVAYPQRIEEVDLREANARLIAKAPEMMEHLKSVLEFVAAGEIPTRGRADLIADLIAKIEGKS